MLRHGSSTDCDDVVPLSEEPLDDPPTRLSGRSEHRDRAHSDTFLEEGMCLSV